MRWFWIFSRLSYFNKWDFGRNYSFLHELKHYVNQFHPPKYMDKSLGRFCQVHAKGILLILPLGKY